ncbi:Helicase ARIP4-like, partial [Homarus americanus]
TKTEFSNMFERPIQNGQCVDSTPQDMKLMRRGHTVLANTLPKKEEHVLLCRMTEIQRKLYSTFMTELAATKAMANPLKAFAICCKIWNHPDVLYNFVQKKINEDFDLDLDEVDGKSKSRRASSISTPNQSLLNVPSHPMPSWASPGPMNRNIPQQLGWRRVGYGTSSWYGSSTWTGADEHESPKCNGSSTTHHGFPGSDGSAHDAPQHGSAPRQPGRSGDYGMGAHNIHQGYGMQMPYPWYNQGYGANDPRSYPLQQPLCPSVPTTQYPCESESAGYPATHNTSMGMSLPNQSNQSLGLPSPSRQSMGLTTPSGQPMGVHNHSGQALGLSNHSGHSMGLPNPGDQSMGVGNSSWATHGHV